MVRPASSLPFPPLIFQVVDLLNQAALITNDSKITTLKQVRALPPPPILGGLRYHCVGKGLVRRGNVAENRHCMQEVWVPASVL